MKRFLSKLAMFGLLFLAIASAADWVVSAGLRESKSQPFSTWNDIYHGRVDADVIVTGSSRAFVHVSPTVIERETGLSTYNLGFNGYHFPMQRIRVSEYLKHNRKPRVVIQTLDVTQFHRRAGLFQYEQFMPYFDQSPIVDAVQNYEGYDFLDRWMPMYRYRGRSDLVRSGVNLWFESQQQYDTDRGYRANDWTWDGSFDDFKERNSDGYSVTIESDVVEMLGSFVGDLKEAGILPVLVFTPEYIEVQKLCKNRDEVVNHFQRIATKHDVRFLDYSGNAICRDRSLFYNSQHLNKMGAERFSHLLANELNQILNDRHGQATEAKSHGGL